MHAPLRSSAVALVVGLGLSAQAATIHVPADQPTIAAGLAAAQPGDEVVLACGTYYERDLQLRGGVNLRSQSGDPTCAVVSASYLGRVFRAAGLVGPVRIEGLTITQGAGGQGGGMYLVDSNVVLRRCVLSHNLAGVGGGGIFAAGTATVRCESCVFVRNLQTPVRQGGAGFRAWLGGRGDLLNCTFANNDPDGAVGEIEAKQCILEASAVGDAECCWTSDPLFCNEATDDYSLSAASPCLPGVFCVPLVGALGLGCGPAPEFRSYNVTTEPTGLPVSVDGATYVSPSTFSWLQYSEHSLDAPKSVQIDAGSQRAFLTWNNGGDRSQTAWATRDPYTWVANFGLEYLLSIAALEGGSISPTSGWRVAGTPATLTATPSRGFVFERWEGAGVGSYSGTSNPVAVAMNGPISETAHFAPKAYEFSISASDVDPWANAAAPIAGTRTLYLWLACSRGGLAAFEATVVGTLPVLGFEPLSGVLNAGSETHLLLAVPGCPSGDPVALRLGRWLVTDSAAGGGLCLGGADDGGSVPQVTIGAVDCGTLDPFFTPYPGVTGFSSSGAAPCRRGAQTCGRAGVPAIPADVAIRTMEPWATALLPNSPNPFSASTEVRFSLAASGHAALRIYDVGGRLVRSLVNEELPAGRHQRIWDGRDEGDRVVSAGMYFLRLESGGKETTRKVLRMAE